jgi:hypothetical protein
MPYKYGMETTVLKKRLNTYKSGKGKLTRVEDEVVMDVLRTWEQWQGSSADLYRELGLSKMQLVTMIQKGKRLVKKGVVSGSDFKEIKISGVASETSSDKIELSWEGGRTIRFSTVSQLLEFLDRVGRSDNV